jgi:hypothetical protein
MPNEGNGPGRSDGYRTVAINSVDLSRSDWKKKENTIKRDAGETKEKRRSQEERQ